MADHYVSLNRGQEGFLYSDFVTGTTTTAAAHFEVRVKDGAHLTKKDVHNFIEAMERFFENAQQVSTTGFDVTDGSSGV